MTEHVPGQIGMTDDLEHQAATARAELERLEELRAVNRLMALDQLRHQAADTRAAGADLDDAVARARAAGATWQQIADAVGMARPSAWQRWNRG